MATWCPLTDPRVRIVFPNFSQTHTQALAMVARWLGLHPGEVVPLDRSQLERGLQHTSGRECLPLPICVGQSASARTPRPGEIMGFFMVRGGAPCVVDSYMGYFERFIAEQQLPDVFMFDLRKENDYGGFDLPELTRPLSAAIPVADILVEIEHVLRVVDAGGSWINCGGTGSSSQPRRLRLISSMPDCPDSLTGWRSCRGRAIL